MSQVGKFSRSRVALFFFSSLLMFVTVLTSCRMEVRQRSETLTQGNATEGSNPGSADLSTAPLTGLDESRLFVVEIPMDVVDKAIPFSSIPLTILSGRKITWENKDRIPHKLTIEDETGRVIASVDLQPGKSFSKELFVQAANQVGRSCYSRSRKIGAMPQTVR